jgi:hypothetical protein
MCCFNCVIRLYINNFLSWFTHIPVGTRTNNYIINTGKWLCQTSTLKWHWASIGNDSWIEPHITSLWHGNNVRPHRNLVTFALTHQYGHTMTIYISLYTSYKAFDLSSRVYSLMTLWHFQFPYHNFFFCGVMMVESAFIFNVSPMPFQCWGLT